MDPFYLLLAPVQLKRSGMNPEFLERHVFLSAHRAMVAIEAERAAGQI